MKSDLSRLIENTTDALVEVIRGGPGSGFFEHAGRPGEVGGSAPSGESGIDLPLAGEIVDGRTVTENIPNLGSISATFTDWDELQGIREVKISDFGTGTDKPVFATVGQREAAESLAQSIKENGWIDPLIIVYDRDAAKLGPYILEGATRFDALRLLGAESFPALVVIDRDPQTGILERGGPGSGHHGHKGRPGEVGGSQPSGADAMNLVKSAEENLSSLELKVGEAKNLGFYISSTGKVFGRRGSSFLGVHAAIANQALSGISDDELNKLMPELEPDAPPFGLLDYLGMGLGFIRGHVPLNQDELNLDIRKPPTIKQMQSINDIYIAQNIVRILMDWEVGPDKFVEFQGQIEDFQKTIKVNRSIERGGPGSGHRGHAGRPGEVGGSAPKGTAPQIDSPIDSFQNDVTASYEGQINGSLIAFDENGDYLGHIDWREFLGDVDIAWITVKEEERRKGIATELVRQLQKEFEGQKILPTMSTDEGTLFLESIRDEAIITFRHLGPGDHPSGTSQDVHAGTRNGGKWDTENLPGPTLVYHGTFLEAGEAIKTEGLRRGDEWNERPPSVYFTTRLNDAKTYARIFGGRHSHAIIEFEIPDDADRSIIFDEDDTKIGFRNSFRIESDIPISWIKKIRTFNFIGSGEWEEVDPILTRAIEVPQKGFAVVIIKNRLVKRGGPGSGFFEHEGRPGEVGGSQPADGDGDPAPEIDEEHSRARLVELLAESKIDESKWEQERKDRLENNRYAQTDSETLQEIANRLIKQIEIAKESGREEDLAKSQQLRKDAIAEMQARREWYRIQRQKGALKEGIQTGKLTLTEPEMGEILAKQNDVYVDARMSRPYEYTPDLFLMSDISGRWIRHYVNLPDGRVAHPDELILSRQRGNIVIVGKGRGVPSRDWTEELTTKGGPGSGHHGHVGRPGEVGGSLPGREGLTRPVHPKGRGKRLLAVPVGTLKPGGDQLPFGARRWIVVSEEELEEIKNRTKEEEADIAFQDAFAEAMGGGIFTKIAPEDMPDAFAETLDTYADALKIYVDQELPRGGWTHAIRNTVRVLKTAVEAFRDDGDFQHLIDAYQSEHSLIDRIMHKGDPKFGLERLSHSTSALHKVFVDQAEATVPGDFEHLFSPYTAEHQMIILSLNYGTNQFNLEHERAGTDQGARWTDAYFKFQDQWEEHEGALADSRSDVISGLLELEAQRAQSRADRNVTADQADLLSARIRNLTTDIDRIIAAGGTPDEILAQTGPLQAIRSPLYEQREALWNQVSDSLDFEEEAIDEIRRSFVENIQSVNPSIGEGVIATEIIDVEEGNWIEYGKDTVGDDTFWELSRTTGGEQHIEHLQLARDRVERALEKDILPDIEDATNFLNAILPPDAIPDIDVRIDYDIDEDSRAHYQSASDTINLERGDGVRTIIHESGHFIEDNVPWIHEAAVSFLLTRGEGKPIKTLSEITGGSYNSYERAFEGVFENEPYAAKVYYRPVTDDYDATEIVSMGLDRIYSNAAQLANEEPQLFDFIMGIITERFKN